MALLRNSSIRTKLKLVILSTSFLSVVLVFAGFFAYEYVTFREILVKDLATKADIVAENSTAALAFHDSADASHVLNSLSSQPLIISAAIYDQNKRLFATYARGKKNIGFPFFPEPEGWYFDENVLVLYKPILFNNSEIGTIYLTMDLVVRNERLRSYTQIAILVLIGSLVVAFIVATGLERNISRPILDLAKIAHQVSQQQDYSIRVPKTTEDETGFLADAMNQMLSQISERDADLRQTNVTLREEIAERKRTEQVLKHSQEEVRKLNEQLEARVLERTAQLEATNKELEAFSYSVSHDLRAPLRHIDGYAQLLAKNAGSMLSEKGKRYLQTISSSAQKLGVLIDDLLVFSRMGRSEMRSSVVNLHDMVWDVIHDAQPETADRSIDWKVAALPHVKGDPSMLRLVLVNLVSNAVKYTRPRAHASIEIGYENLNRETVFYIKDNGVGFNMEYVGRLFGVFQRLHTVNEFEGTGIGLANVRRIIVRHGGRTWAQGEIDKGATFYFSLPRTQILT